VRRVAKEEADARSGLAGVGLWMRLGTMTMVAGQQIYFIGLCIAQAILVASRLFRDVGTGSNQGI